MYESALVRSKWEREDYLFRTILKACAQQTSWCVDKKKLDGRAAVALGFLSIEEQIKLFKGCTYIQDEHKILVPSGDLLTPDRFRVAYGGYSMPLDFSNQRSPSRNAWEVFTESQAFKAPYAHTTCFRPQATPGSVIEEEGRLCANIYFPANIIMKPGKPLLYLQHISKLFPDEREATIYHCYSAALVQYPGVKFKWCPFIQGVPGNGKTLLLLVLAKAIGRRYTHFAKAPEIANKFNDWLYEKIFIGVDDMFTEGPVNTVLEILKPMITGVIQEIEAKRETKVSKDVCANFVITSNHKDGLRKSQDDRRLAYFYTPQQTVSDLFKDGMDARYFKNLHSWLDYEGYHIVNHFLKNYKIQDEFNPATYCMRAPLTLSTEEAIKHGSSALEQEIVEAIQQGAPGFRGGWISSIMLDRFLQTNHLTRFAPRCMRTKILHILGYVKHPLLKDGRATVMLQPDGAKPSLYVTRGHPALSITDIYKLYDMYTGAQSTTRESTGLVAISAHK